MKMKTIRIDAFSKLDKRRLMDVYAESNYENTDYFYPDMTDKKRAAELVEEGFLDFLENEFFKREGSAYWILEDEDEWVSALRTSRIEEGLYYIEALETRPDSRRKGYAERLLGSVIDELKKSGPFRLCDCVWKKNEASVRTHLKCGFVIKEGPGMDLLRGDFDEEDYGMEYSFER